MNELQVGESFHDSASGTTVIMQAPASRSRRCSGGDRQTSPLRWLVELSVMD